jgi:hypothetical protein
MPRNVLSRPHEAVHALKQQQAGVMACAAAKLATAPAFLAVDFAALAAHFAGDFPGRTTTPAVNPTPPLTRITRDGVPNSATPAFRATNSLVAVRTITAIASYVARAIAFVARTAGNMDT